jgi:hypothetical protein
VSNAIPNRWRERTTPESTQHQMQARCQARRLAIARRRVSRRDRKSGCAATAARR